jgi:guanylate kinase
VSTSSASPVAEPGILVLIGPGGTGKGTIASRLLATDPNLWLSRSWTTRPQREGEDDDAYVFVDRPRFEAHVAQDGFLEWAEFLGNLYGTPNPVPPEGRDVLLEIEVEGARQILDRHPSATVILLLPPSEAVQEERLRRRGDPEHHVQRRLEEGRSEVAQGRELAHHEVVNDDLEQAVGEIIGILEALRRGRSAETT